MEEIGTLLLLAVSAEAIWETLLMVKLNGGINKEKLGAIVIGIILAIAARVDFFYIMGVPLAIPYLGMVFTGIIISRGANFIHDIIKITEVVKIKNKAQI
ncbi:hypothetical protein SAMN02745221_01465 [Thermosyntropha lipolytica DSM 11003]|uniref:Uncharacterized protein n=1 Tax=Thermosyntropha lipolytica DSM 11003 TaxID=1123382 RepID=A0A1M5PGP7_9FIRM|nr:hypothetical protein [Thermosyntropha lipolytica]SHH00609.1 hypothetical protein SAMN02745221_01465 [Thermosyntropha lipolytica DSM 11003]